jgi:hypothetical protein
MNKIALILAAAGLAAFSGAAVAQGTPTFATADANHDGFVDFGEAQAAFPGLTQNNFDQVDTNKDGKLTQDEFNQLGGTYSPQNNQSSSASK